MPDSTIDETLALLASRRRRLALRGLRGAEGDWVAAATLADYVAERSTDVGGGATRRTVRVALHHVELPKLADAGVVDYDRAAGRARYRGGPDADLVERLLGLTEALRP